MSRTIRVEYEISNELLESISVTASEGGINYWADIEYGRIIGIADDELDEPVDLFDLGMIKEGIEFALSGNYCNDRIRGYIMNAVVDNDACHIDADAADVIVQLAVFKGLVYA